MMLVTEPITQELRLQPLLVADKAYIHHDRHISTCSQGYLSSL
jgi:hypothetical protein